LMLIHFKLSKGSCALLWFLIVVVHCDWCKPIGGATGYAGYAEAYPHVKYGMLSIPYFQVFHKV